MATTTGGGAAYQRLQVPKDGISQALQFWGGQEAKKIADGKLADEREGIRKKKEVEDWETKYGLKEGDFKNKYTGFKSFDDMNTDFSMYATDEYVNLQRQAKDALTNGDLKEKTRLEGEMIRLKNAFGEAAKSQEFFGQKFADYQKAVTDKKVSGASKDFEDIVQEAILNKNVALRMVDGNLVYTGMKDGKDGVREPFNIPYQDLMDGSFGWYEKQQINGKGGIIDNILGDLGTITKENENGYYKITTQEWDEAIHGKAVDDSVEALLGNDEVMGDLLYQFSKGKESKMFGFEKKDYDIVRPKLKEMIRAGYSEKFGSEFNSGKYATDSRAATERDKNKKEEKDPLSYLHQDALDFEKGDFTGLLGRHTTDTDEEVNIREAIPSPDGKYVIAVTDSGERIEIANTKRGFLEFKLRGNAEYKGISPETVFGTKPIKYRNGTTEGSSIANIAKDLFNEEGKPTVDDEEFLKRLKETFDITGDDNWTWKGNSLTINGKNVSTASEEEFITSLEAAIGKTGKNNNGSGYQARTQVKGR
jgi:hypothetical protein